MELALVITVAVLFALLGLVCVASVVIGLPGAWMLLALAVLIELADPLYLGEEHQPTFGWWLLGGCTVLAVIGEILEFAAGALGAKKAGSSRSGMIGALVGGVVGAVLGLALPIPIAGSLIGALGGTFLGAMAGELRAARASGEAAGAASVRGAVGPATGATVGKILGTLSKLPIALAIWIALTVVAAVP